MLPVLAFDMNGTLFDTGVLDDFFAARTSTPNLRREWFLELIGLTGVANATGYYEPFPALAESALDVVARRHALRVAKEDREEFKAQLQTMPPFSDVIPTLQRLREAKFRMAILTNSPVSSADKLLHAADIRDSFEAVISVEEVQVFKPDARVYQRAAQQMKVAPSEMMLVAAHAWDTTGAIRAGLQAAFVGRPGEYLPPNAPKPQIIAADLVDLANQLCARGAGS